MEISLSCGSEIDDKNSQYGDNRSPGIEFRDVPEDAESIALFMENLNASPTRKTHWIIWNIPPGENLPEGIDPEEEPAQPEGAVQGNNSFSVMGYTGPPYPPGGETYRFTAYALDSKLSISAGPTADAVRQAMKGKVIDKAVAEAGYTN